MFAHDPIPIPSTLAAVPPGFDAWFAKATNRDPSERYGSAQELVSALRDVVEGRAATGANPQLDGGNVRGLSLASAPTIEARAAELIPSAGALVVAASTGVTAVSATTGATGVTPSPATLTVPMKRSPLLLSVAVGAVAIALGGGALLFRSLVFAVAVDGFKRVGGCRHCDGTRGFRNGARRDCDDTNHQR